MPFWINLAVAAGAFVISAVLGALLIPFLKKLNFGQTILEIGPRWHKSKEGTPTMGGFMFIAGCLAATAGGYFLWRSNRGQPSAEMSASTWRLLCGLAFAVFNCAIGFIDDYIKVLKKQNLGLSSKQKLLLQFVAASLYLWILHMLGDGTTIAIPFCGLVDFGWAYYPIMILFITFLVNAVNLSDGIDGLCGSITTVAAVSLMLVAVLMSENEQAIFAMALAGACVGFLVWNFHPAKVFMGDTGSMFLGGAVVSIGMATRQHLLLALICLVYIVEALSVVIQVISFKTTGKRVFKMSPIHHHFEMCGWEEYKIVAYFSLTAILAGAAAVVIAATVGTVV